MLSMTYQKRSGTIVIVISRREDKKTNTGTLLERTTDRLRECIAHNYNEMSPDEIKLYGL
jgi:hypothetical protein